METPKWAYVAGIIMMLFGGCGALGDLQQINTPKMMEMQQKIFKGFSEGMESDSAMTLSDSIRVQTDTLNIGKGFSNMAKSMEEVWQMSDFTKTWIVRFGYIGLFVSLMYILGGVFLLIKKPFSIKLAYGVIVLSILFEIIRAIVLSSDAESGMMSMAMSSFPLFGIVVDIVLIVVIATSDKSAYRFDHDSDQSQEDRKHLI